MARQLPGRPCGWTWLSWPVVTPLRWQATRWRRYPTSYPSWAAALARPGMTARRTARRRSGPWPAGAFAMAAPCLTRSGRDCYHTEQRGQRRDQRDEIGGGQVTQGVEGSGEPDDQYGDDHQPPPLQ